VPYLVMERLEGKNLAEILRSERALTDADVVELSRQISAGITAATSSRRTCSATAAHGRSSISFGCPTSSDDLVPTLTIAARSWHRVALPPSPARGR
jgi:serine/threonine protein kinase